MRKILFILGLLSAAYFGRTQSNYTDSLLNVIRSSKDVQTRLDASAYCFWQNAYAPADSIMHLGDQLESFGKGQDYTDVQALGKLWRSWAYNSRAETYKALACLVEALKQAEIVDNNSLFASIFNGFGATYDRANLPERTIQNFKKALSYLQGTTTLATDLITKRIVLTNLGIWFTKKQQYDSALNYLQRAMELWVLLSKDSRLSPGLFYGRIGDAYLGLGQYKLAYACYQTNLDYAKRFNSKRMLRGAYFFLGKYHRKTGNKDSALAYFQLALSFDESVIGPDQLIEPALTLYQIFKGKGNDREALKYLELYHSAKQKADSLQEGQHVEALSFDEDQRQQTVAAEKAKRAEERKRNLQYVAIALGLVTLMVFFLLFSHTIMANPKLIRFLGVVALLIVFEFINLFIHPFLAHTTNDSPFLMLLAMVCIAALLVPLHHRLQHWITHKLVEKNNRIRLASAKKTIAELEGKVIDVSVEKDPEAR